MDTITPAPIGNPASSPSMLPRRQARDPYDRRLADRLLTNAVNSLKLMKVSCKR